MEGFFKSFSPIFKKNKLQVVYAILAVVISLISLGIYVKESNNSKDDIVFETQSDNAKPNNEPKQSNELYVEVSGAIEQPNVYKMPVGARLKDVIVAAKGLSVDADRAFFARNFNLARYVSDQEKIHIPTQEEIQSGTFIENVRIIDYTQAKILTPQTVLTQNTQNQNQPKTDIININTASAQELEALPGVGKVTAQKIIDARLYTSVDDLLNKKVVNKGVFEQIKDKVAVN